MRISRLLPATALVLTLGLIPAAQSASAAPPIAAATAKADTDNGIVQVRRGFGTGVGLGLGLGLFTGAVIASESYRPRAGYYYDDYSYDGPYYYPSSYRGDPRSICAQNFRSFEWDTGLYTTYGGDKRLCPYLR